MHFNHSRRLFLRIMCICLCATAQSECAKGYAQKNDKNEMLKAEVGKEWKRDDDLVYGDQCRWRLLVNPVSHPHEYIKKQTNKMIVYLFPLNLGTHDWHDLLYQQIWAEFLLDCGASWKLGEWHGLKWEIFQNILEELYQICALYRSTLCHINNVD